jgi:hypothetical protein
MQLNEDTVLIHVYVCLRHQQGDAAQHKSLPILSLLQCLVLIIENIGLLNGQYFIVYITCY